MGWWHSHGLDYGTFHSPDDRETFKVVSYGVFPNNKITIDNFVDMDNLDEGYNLNYSKKDGIFVINTSNLLQDVINLMEQPKNKREDIAAIFQKELGKTFAEVAIKVADSNGVNKVGLTGGVAYNYSFSQAIKNKISQAGLEFLEHDLLPPGDAGISIGQLIGGLFQYLRENK